MGYRSHVLFSITEVADVSVRLTNPKISPLLDSADRVHNKKWSDDTPYIIYEWDHVKWYDSDEEVRALMEWIEDIESSTDDDDYGFMFLRDGEDMNDIEHHGSWNMGLTYGIEIENES